MQVSLSFSGASHQSTLGLQQRTRQTRVPASAELHQNAVRGERHQRKEAHRGLHHKVTGSREKEYSTL